MRSARIGIVALVTALVASNGWWAYRMLDEGITITYLDASLKDNQVALSQTLAILPVVARGEASREQVLAAAKIPGDDSDAFEKDGFVWVGRIGLKFDEHGRFLSATRDWSPP